MPCEKVRKTRQRTAGVYYPLPRQKQGKLIFAFDIRHRYVILISRSYCGVLSCQFAVGSCKAGKVLKVLQTKRNSKTLYRLFTDSLSNRTFTCHIKFDCLWHVWLCRTCRNYPIKGMVFEKKTVFNMKYIFSHFLHKFYPKFFSFLEGFSEILS